MTKDSLTSIKLSVARKNTIAQCDLHIRKEEIDGVQKKATKHVKHTKHLSYEDRLDTLELSISQYLLKCADLLLLYKMMNDSVDMDRNIHYSLILCSKKGMLTLVI